MLFAVGKVPSKKESSFSPPPFRPVESVRRAGVNAVTLCAFVCLFGAVGYVIRATLPIPILVSVLLSVTEISGACAYIGSMAFPLVLRGTLTAFAVAFSGLSVLWQAMSFLSDTDLRFGRFFAIKTVQSFLAALLGFVCFSVL